MIFWFFWSQFFFGATASVFAPLGLNFELLLYQDIYSKTLRAQYLDSTCRKDSTRFLQWFLPVPSGSDLFPLVGVRQILSFFLEGATLYPVGNFPCGLSI